MFRISEDFPPASRSEWTRLVERELQGAPLEKLVTTLEEGLSVGPLYTAESAEPQPDAAGLPGAPPFVRGGVPVGDAPRRWRILQPCDRADGAAAEELRGGAGGLVLRFARGARPGLALSTIDALERALDGVDLATSELVLDAGGRFFPAALALSALWKRRGVLAPRGSFAADPLGALAAGEALPGTPERAFALAARLVELAAEHGDEVLALEVSTAPYDLAGATLVQSLAFALASGVAHLRAAERAGIPPEATAPRLGFALHLGTELFPAVAQLRAARRLWCQVLVHAGVPASAQKMRIHAHTSARVLATRDPWVNMLRATVSSFAAAVGGADAITTPAFDAALGPASDSGRRVARNTQLILAEEAHLGHVLDPAGGSWFVERLTLELAERAWALFQEIERRGGMLLALESGWVQQEVDRAHAARAQDVQKRRRPLTGVSEFPNLDEQALERPASTPETPAAGPPFAASALVPRLSSDAAAVVAARDELLVGASAASLAAAMAEGGETSGPGLPVRRLAQPFERLRDASDAFVAAHGRRPEVFLASLGPVPAHLARTSFAQNLLEAGGVRALVSDGFPDADAAAAAFARSGARAAVICSSDALYGEQAAATARALREAGAQQVLLAGRPGERAAEWESAGIDGYVFLGADVVAILEDVHQVLGVTP